MPPPPQRAPPPREQVRQAVMHLLCLPGRTIGGIRPGGAPAGDAPQAGMAGEPVWHGRREILDGTAGMLRVHPDLWGPRRVSSDFYNMVDGELERLRGRRLLVDWNAGRRAGVFRLADVPARPPPPPRPSMAGPIPGRRDAPAALDVSPGALKRDFLSILTKGRKDNTYKFALARALLDYCWENRDARRPTHEIPYSYLSAKFLEYYWHQVCRFRIRQTFHVDKAPKVVQAIRDVFGDPPPSFGQTREADRREAEGRILRQVFGHARSKTSLVVPKFQKVPSGAGVEEVRRFYDYDDDAKALYLRGAAFDFFNDNHWMLSKSVLVEWAKLLERINGSLPMLVAKIENDERRRGDLGPFKRAYWEHTRHCFYCGDRLELRLTHADHFIPWSYIFGDDAWNMVLACSRCNLKKHDSLPQEEFRSELIARNRKYRGRIGILGRSLQLLERGRGWDAEIISHYDNCHEYGFGRVRMP